MSPTLLPAPAPPARAPVGAGRSVSPGLVIACALLGAGAWLLDRHVLHIGVLTKFQGRAALSPLYAFWIPLLRPQALGFVAAAALLLALAPRVADPARCSRRVFLAALFGLALLVPLALFCVRQDPGALGSQFLIYRNEEFYADAQRVQSPGAFLEHYVERMPSLSLHGQHFPPGHALLLYAVRQVLGPGVFPAGLVVLGAFALALVLAYGALRELADEHAARQGALLLLACPSLVDFACTSMDTVFLAWAMGCWWLGLRALAFRERAGRVRDALLAGSVLCLACCFSFATFPVGLALALYGLWLARERARQPIAQLAWIGAGFVLTALAVHAVTGFALWACVAHARESGLHLMSSIVGADPGTLHAQFSYGNATAFLIGAGLALVPAAYAGVRAPGAPSATGAPDAIGPWMRAVLLALLIMSAGGIFFMETERIWLFAMPWLAALALAPGALRDGSLRLLLAAGCAQALVMEVLLFTLW